MWIKGEKWTKIAGNMYESVVVMKINLRNDEKRCLIEILSRFQHSHKK